MRRRTRQCGAHQQKQKECQRHLGSNFLLPSRSHSCKQAPKRPWLPTPHPLPPAAYQSCNPRAGSARTSRALSSESAAAACSRLPMRTKAYLHGSRRCICMFHAGQRMTPHCFSAGHPLAPKQQMREGSTLQGGGEACAARPRTCSCACPAPQTAALTPRCQTCARGQGTGALQQACPSKPWPPPPPGGD